MNRSVDCYNTVKPPSGCCFYNGGPELDVGGAVDIKASIYCFKLGKLYFD